MKKPVLGVVTALLVLGMAVPLWAQTNFWIAPGGGMLNNAANWSLGAPAKGQTLCFTNPASYAITNNSYFNLGVESLFNASRGTVTYVGNSTRIQTSILIGTVPGATATVDFVKGRVEAPYGAISVGQNGGRGHMRMRDEMDFVYTYLDINVGDNSDCNTLEVRDGAVLLKANNGTYIRVGRYASENTLRIAAGGVVTNLGYFAVGVNSSDYSNRVVVTDSGSSLTLDGARNNWIGGGYGRYNELIVTNGGHVTVLAGNAGLVIGQYGRYNLTVVTGRHSLLECAGRLALAAGGSAYPGNRLDILDGGRAEMATLEFTGATASRVTVAGAGSLLRAGEAQVGKGTGAAIMEVSDGALAEAEVLTVGTGTGANSQVLADDAALVATNAAGDGIFEVRRGTVSLSNGSTLTADSLCITNTAAANCRLTATIGSTPAGVMLTRNDPAAIKLAVPGGLKLVFAADPAAELKPLWGLRISGDQVALLAGLVADGKITYDTSALSSVSQKRFGVHYDAESDTSFIGLSKKIIGSYLLLR